MTGADATAAEQPFAEQAFAVAAGAYSRGPEGWERSVHRAIADLFAFLADHPRRTRACVLADPLGQAVLHDRTIGRFVDLLRPGFRESEVAPPPVVAEAVIGGVYEVLRWHAREQRLEQLPAAVPDATIVALSPFIGTDRAFELLAEMGAPEPRRAETPARHVG